MVDPVSTVALTGAALATGRKVLGPTIDQFAKDLAAVYSAWRAENFARILQRVSRRSEPMPDGEAVHPRVAHEVLDAGSWINDDVQQEYLAGLLLTSRSPGGADDSGTYYAGIASRMTAAQTRLHFLIYASLEGTATGDQNPISIAFNEAKELCVITETSELEKASGVTGQAVVEALDALWRAGLIGQWGTGRVTPDRPEPMSWAEPTSIGARLYLRARGIKDVFVDMVRSSELKYEPFDPEPERLTSATLGLPPVN
ncbi:hypothetical protein ABRQ22_16770 [Cellulosimicrobium sp. ES-005]|uniref:Uncharacterized protein n=1 Tax=Cellulosimicrobium sp. ES-005 TaxID=3163031 RepID=A0AAU8FYX3_9MICO